MTRRASLEGSDESKYESGAVDSREISIDGWKCRGVRMSDDREGDEIPYEVQVQLRHLNNVVKHMQAFTEDLAQRLAMLEMRQSSKDPKSHDRDPLNPLGLLWTPHDLGEVPLLHTFPLQNDLGRRSFLATLYWAYQQGGILAATNHVWASLADPKATRANRIGKAAGVSGRGKAAIRHTLERFLEEARKLRVPDPPERKDFESFDDWNNMCIKHFQSLQLSLNLLLVRFSTALNGCEA